jgi:hypothetical protein
MLRAISRLARPVAAFGHDWVLDTGFRQFSARAIGADVAAALVEPPAAT